MKKVGMQRAVWMQRWQMFKRGGPSSAQPLFFLYCFLSRVISLRIEMVLEV